MISIQKIIIDWIQVLIRHEIANHFRLVKADLKNLKKELGEHKGRLTQLEKVADIDSHNVEKQTLKKFRLTGATLKNMRKRWGISQRELSILLATDPATVNRWETNKVKISLKSCERIAAVRDLSKPAVKKMLQSLGGNAAAEMPDMKD